MLLTHPQQTIRELKQTTLHSGIIFSLHMDGSRCWTAMWKNSNPQALQTKIPMLQSTVTYSWFEVTE